MAKASDLRFSDRKPSSFVCLFYSPSNSLAVDSDND